MTLKQNRAKILFSWQMFRIPPVFDYGLFINDDDTIINVTVRSLVGLACQLRYGSLGASALNMCWAKRYRLLAHSVPS